MGIILAAINLIFGVKQLRSTPQGTMFLAFQEARLTRSRLLLERVLAFGSMASAGWLYAQINEILNFRYPTGRACGF